MKRVIGLLLFSLMISNQAQADMELKASQGPMDSTAPGLRAGEMAPDFKAMTHSGNLVQLSELTASGPVVLVFYRGAWCPYCNLHLQQFQKKIKDFNALGATILAVSVDKAEYAEKTAAENNLDFQVITDPEASVLEIYGLLYTVPEELALKYKNEYGIDLEKHSGRPDYVIAVPGTYVINQEGRIIFAYASEDYTTRTHPDEVLEVLKNQA